MSVPSDAPPAFSGDAREAIRPAIEEIVRRERACADVDASAPRDAADEMPSLPGQRYALLTVGTSVLAPRPLEPSFPALRVYGCFETRQDAQDHAEEVARVDPSVSRIVLACGEWFLFPQTEEVLRDREAAGRRLAARLADHRAREDAAGEAFERAREQGEERPVHWDKTDWTEEQEEELDAERTVYPRPRRLRAGAEVRGQAAFACCVAPDPAGEVLLKVLGAFESTADANAWAEEVGTRRILSDAILIAPTCEWVFPNGTRVTADKETYRIQELQKIMDAAKANPHKVRDYKAWKAEQDRQRLLREGGEGEEGGE